MHISPNHAQTLHVLASLLLQVCEWVNAKSTIPVWAKMTPNITDVTLPAHAALEKGCAGGTSLAPPALPLLAARARLCKVRHAWG